jgi:putative FmdB family regulatory protein
MPIYEYSCDKCRKIYSFLVRNLSTHKTPKCPKCGKGGMKRRISAFRIGRTEESRFDRLADPSALAGLNENDPRALGQWMKKLGNELGEDMPEEMDEMSERLAAGENPEDIERQMGVSNYARDNSGKLYEA